MRQFCHTLAVLGRGRGGLPVAAGLAALAVGVALTFNYTADDPLITLRYASNLLHGHGPVFNVGERAEGYSSPLHLLVATVALVVPGGHGLLKLKVLSLLAAALTIGAADRLGRRLELALPWRVAACAVIGASSIFAISAGNGLETTLTALLVTLLTTALVTSRNPGWRSVAGVTAALLVLSRPEGIAVVVAMAAACVVQPGSRRVRDLAWAAPAGMVVAMSTILRLAYYGEPVANTYYAKRLGPRVAIHDARTYLLSVTGNAWSHSHGLLLAAIAGTGCAVLLGVALVSRPATLIVAGAVGAQAAFVVAAGGDWMPGGRFLAPVLPDLFVVLAVGVVALADRTNGVARTAVVGVAALSAVAVTGLPYRTQRAPVWRLAGVSDAALISSSPIPLAPVWTVVAREPCVRAGMTVAYSEVGLFGFAHRDVRVLDTRGLTDEVIARRSPTTLHHQWGVEDPDWAEPTSVVGARILEERPDLIVAFNPAPVQQALGARYVLVRQEPGLGAENIEILRRSDVACPAG